MTILYASVHGRRVTVGGRQVRTQKLQDAIDDAEPGDTVHVLGGRYVSPVRVTKSGTATDPITIRGESGNETLLDGRRSPEQMSDQGEAINQFAFVKIDGASHIQLENLAFDNCWPTGLLLNSAKQIGISTCNFVGGQFAIHAVNGSRGNRTSDITISQCKWEQDPNYDLWEGRISWHDVKQEHVAQHDRRYMNGAFFKSLSAAGNISITGCDISHCFNGIILRASRHRPHGNQNVRITDCRFSYIRDNAVEPEGYAENLWVVNNVFYNVHGTFSHDGVGGKNWYFFGNRVLNTRRPGRLNQANRGGKIYKFHEDEPYPTENFYTAFNSIWTRTAYFKRGTTRNWTHANNAISICRTGPHCNPNRAMIGRRFQWHDSLAFENDMSDHPDFPDGLQQAGFPVSGIHAEDSVFKAPNLRPGFTRRPDEWDGDLQLAVDSPGIGASTALTVNLPDGGAIDVPPGYDLGAPAPPELLAASHGV